MTAWAWAFLLHNIVKVILAGLRQVGAEIPVDSDDADTENKDDNGSTLLCVFERGCCLRSMSTAVLLFSLLSWLSIVWKLLHLIKFCRDCMGDSTLAGDPRWAGTFGVNLDFVARCHCSVEFISTEDIKVCHHNVQFAPARWKCAFFKHSQVKYIYIIPFCRVYWRNLSSFL
jgi:hypothetical protein